MGFLKKLFGKWFTAKNREQSIEDEEESLESVVLQRDSVNLYDQGQRMGYVRSCLEQMKDAEIQIGSLTKEYSMVTSYLTDMEELEALPVAEKKELSVIADKITAYEKEKICMKRKKIICRNRISGIWSVWSRKWKRVSVS